jgi:phosphoglucomutase
MAVHSVPTTPYPDQQPGTAGLRRKVSVFRQEHYLQNFLQAIFDSTGDFAGETMIAGGDGRYFNREALQIVAEVAAGNGVKRLVVGQGGLLSTPAASLLISHCKAAGGLLLTASHNPGGVDGDFGIKLNTASGGQASERLTAAIYEASRRISRYLYVDVGPVDFDSPGKRRYGPITVQVVDPVADYADVMQRLFDFDRIGALLRGGQFRMRFDALHAVTGPYAKVIFEQILGGPAGSVVNGTPLEDFGGGHPDPNPVDAAALVAFMGRDDAPQFAAASDGDGDRNMILGRGLVVSPGDSLAILAANATLVPGYAGGLNGLARSMPTSRAADRVAERLGVPCYETPTGWRFFSNLLEDGRITLCGEESFGTSSDHAREKDGLWAVLFWLDLQAATGRDVVSLVHEHWAEYGRNAFCRHDYFIPDADQGRELYRALEARVPSLAGRSVGTGVASADIFSYRDPVDGSVSEHQGVRLMLEDDSRIVYRLSGTGTTGATLRIYLERIVTTAGEIAAPAAALTDALGRTARDLAQIPERIGLETPTGII